MNPTLRPTRPGSQQGVATLFMTLVLLLVAGLVLLYTSRSAIMEQRLSANETRAKQAFAAANSGLDHAFAYMSQGGIDHDGTAGVDTITPLTLTNTNAGTAQTASYYAATYCDPTASTPICPQVHASVPACTAPSNANDVIVVSCGWSDDDTAVHRVTQRVGGTPGLSGKIPNPLISRGTADLLTGGASIFNYFNDLSVWSGGSALNQSAGAKTFVRNTASFPDSNAALDSDSDTIPDYRDTGNSPNCNSVPTGYVVTSCQGSLGHDVISGDTRLNVDPEAFFRMFFGSDRDDYRDHTAGFVVDPSGTVSSRDSVTSDDIYSTPIQNIWVEGNLTIDQDLGTKDNPVVLIVNGEVTFHGNTNINGIVYAYNGNNGTVQGSGTTTIYGAFISGTTANGGSNLKIIYDPYDGKGLAESGKPTKLQGSWKDW